jgi:hypothetical protein
VISKSSLAESLSFDNFSNYVKFKVKADFIIMIQFFFLKFAFAASNLKGHDIKYTLQWFGQMLQRL